MLKASLVIVGVGAFLMPASHAQTCMDPASLCDQWWDSSTSKWVQNPTCAWLNHTFLLSDTISANPADGYAYSPNGMRCGAESNGTPCGVKTTTNTCSESVGPILCDPFSDPYCCGDPYDPTCGLGGDGGGGGHGFLRECPPADGVVPEVRGGAGVEASLRRAVLTSPLTKPMSTLLQGLAKAESIHLKAKLTLSLDGRRTISGYEYWERGARYRIRLSPGAEFPWSEVAFNGTFLQAQIDKDAVEIRRGDDRLTPLPDGPLALALTPLRVNDPSLCPLCQLRLADLKKALQWRLEASPGLKAAEATLGAGLFDAGAQRTGEADADGRLVHLVSPSEAVGRDTGFEVTLGDYAPLGGSEAVFPMRLSVRLRPNAFVEYAVEKIELSPSFGDEVFDIYSKSPKVLFGIVDATGKWNGRYVRYMPTPGATSCYTSKEKSKP